MGLPAIERLAGTVRAVLDEHHGSLESVGFRSFPAGACADACDLLGELLRASSLGVWQHVHAGRGASTHSWLERHGTIVDITADQFADYGEPVTVASASTWHSGWVVEWEERAGLGNGRLPENESAFRQDASYVARLAGIPLTM